MSRILIGTSSWADHSLVESGLFYPPEVKTPAGRLSYYSERFPIAEIDSSYHYFPTRQNLNLWLENTDSGKAWRPAPEAEPTTKTQSEGSAKKQSTRRKAASNLMDNSAPRIERNTDNMSDEDLWDSVPEPKEDF